MPYPYGTDHTRIYYAITVPADVSNVSGFEVVADAAGNGVNVLILQGIDAANRGGVKLTDTQVINLVLAPDIAPAWGSNPGAVAGRTTQLKRGHSTLGVATSPSYWISRGATAAWLQGSGGGRDSMFVPPGFRAAFIQTAINVAVNVNVCLEEI